MLIRPAVAMSLLGRLVGAQMGDTVTLSVGDPSIDGRYLTPHRALVVVTVTKDSATLSSRSYLLDKFVTRWRGRPAFRLVLHAAPDAPDSTYWIESVLDRRTMALLHREERDGSGRFATYDVDGARVAGRVRSGAGALPESLDVTLARPSFLSVFVDAAINASPLRAGRVFRVPTFDVIGRRTEWHTFHVAGRDAAAWIIEEDSTARYRRRRIWLTREPPFFPLDITDLPDGSVRRIAQTLVRRTS